MTQKKSTASKKNQSKATASNLEETSFDFEASFSELEKIVEKLENGQVNLEQSLEDFERGINLTRSCQTALNNAQQKVKILLQKNDQSSLEDYE
jgi:exodeoxyribonuclease VII small subunit